MTQDELRKLMRQLLMERFGSTPWWERIASPAQRLKRERTA